MAQKEKDMSRTVMTGDALKTRRNGMKELVVEIFAECKDSMHLGGVVKKWEEKTKQKHDRISWYDCLHAIEDLVNEGKVAVEVPEKGRTTYKAVPVAEDAQLTLNF